MTNIIGRKIDGFLLVRFRLDLLYRIIEFSVNSILFIKDAGRHAMEHRPLAVGPPRSVGGRPLLEEKWVSSPSAFFYLWGGSVLILVKMYPFLVRFLVIMYPFLVFRNFVST